MELNLKKPIVFLDIEATGLDIINDRIIEIALLKCHPGGKEQERLELRVNPEKEISESALKVHGITGEELKDEPVFSKIASKILQFLEHSDVAGFNLLKFDLPILMEEFMRADISFSLKNRKVIDVQKIFHMMEKRTLEAAYLFYCGKKMENSHNAMADTQATYEVFLSQIEMYDQLTNDLDKIYSYIGQPGSKLVDMAGRMVYDKDGNEIFNFGKYKGRKVEDILKSDPGYYGWMMQKEFPEYTKKKLTEIRLRIK